MARGQPAAAVEPSGLPQGPSPAAGSALAAQPAWGAIVIWMAVLAFMVSCTGCALLVRWAGRSSTSSYGYDKPQRFHIGERSEEHTSELQSQSNLVCRLLLEKKKKTHVKTCRLHPRSR